MMSKFLAAWLLAAGALFAVTSAQQSPQAPFRFERPIVASGAGPHRLAIDVTLLTGGSSFRVVSRSISPAGEISAVAAGGLSDLRLFDSSGQEVEYLLVANPPAEPVWLQAAAILPVAPLETEHEKTSGFEADLGDSVIVNRVRIEGLAAPFLKRVRLEGSGDRAHWTLLVGEGTVFDLPDARLRQTELAFTPGSYRYLRLTWDDARSGRVPAPRLVSARRVTSIAAPAPLTTAVGFQRRPSEPGRSRFRLRLPGGHLPIVALDLDVSGEHVMRDASIYEAQLSGYEAVPVLIGRAPLKKVQEGSLIASSLRVPIAAPTEAELELVVDDGNSASLELRGVTAVFAELPWIYFESQGDMLAARYGSRTLVQPKYDLEAVRATLHIETIPDTRWGEARARTSEENGAGPSPLPTIGASLDPASFQYVRDLPAGDPGLVALRLDAAALAHSEGADRGFSDLRVIDAAARQVPYLVERSSEPLSIDLSLERLATAPKTLPPPRGTRTVYRWRPPFERLPSPRLVLTTSARVFQRSISIGVEREPNPQRRDPWIQTFAGATWVHADQDSPAPALAISLPRVDAKELFLIVEEGDNSPLPIGTARLLLPSYRLRFFREKGALLRLAYGRADLTSPRYDLALLAPQVFGTAATEVVPGAEQHGQAAVAGTVALLSPWIFWTCLGTAACVLLALIARLLRKGTA